MTNCEQCGKEFKHRVTAKGKYTRFCSTKCAVQAKTLPQTTEELVEMYERLGTCKRVAAEIGCNTSVVSRRLKRAGYKLDRSWSLPPDPSEVVTVYEEVRSIQQLADHFKVCRETMSSYLDRHNIERIPHKAAPNYVCPGCGVELKRKRYRNSKAVQRCWKCHLTHHVGPEHHLYGKPVPWVTGKNHHLWSGGVSSQQADRGTAPYREWKLAVHERDSWACVLCGDTDGIIAHHIYPMRDFDDLKHDVDNGITLCRKCHGPTVANEYKYAQMLSTHVLLATEESEDFREKLDLV